MKINKNYPLSLAVDSFLRAMDGTRQPSWVFSEEPVQSARPANYRVLEQEDLYEVKFLLPGFSRKEISVSLEGSNLTVSASCGETESEEGFGKKPFTHSIEVPESCEKDKVTAKLESGILKVVLPKSKKPKAVQVKIA